MSNVPITTWISLFALMISVIGMFRTAHKDTRTDAAKDAIITAKLDSISSGVEDIRVEIRTMRDRQNAMSERMAAIETDLKSVHHRLDALEAKD